jgi:hypothetical protein
MTDEHTEEAALELLGLMDSGDYSRMEEIKAGMSDGDRASIAGYLMAELIERDLRDATEELER